RSPNQEAKKRENLLSSLKKDDRVVTIGGIIGTVANISSNGKEITLKMDDNSKVRFVRTAIQGKFSSEENEAESKSA
ncbi:MAG: preprotein translocase subunit YajC, partial [Planctomycetaceae bacterium]|nr:preprotein translocase subunit YajC [Planctomycetaceae bacterium]